MLTYRTEVREVSLVSGRWSWTWLFLHKNLTKPKFYTFLSLNKSASARLETYGLRPAMQGGTALPRKVAVLAVHSP